MVVHQGNYEMAEEKDGEDDESTTTIPLEDDHKGSDWSQILAGLCAEMCVFPAGVSVGYSAVLIPQLEAPDSDFKVDKDGYSTIASVLAISNLFGDLMAGWLVDRFGRLTTIKMALIPFVIGWICIALSTNLPLMVFGRVIIGFSTAMTTGPGIAYFSEVVPPKFRGTIFSLGVSVYFLGTLLVYLVGALLHWRTVAWIAIASCVLPYILLKMFATESPLWLISKGRDEEARKSLEFLLRWGKKPGKIERQMEAMIENQKKNRGSRNKSVISRTLKGLSKPTGYKPMIIIMFMCFFHEFSGSFVLVYYTVSIFQGLGATLDPYVCTVGVGAIGLAISLMSTTTMRYFGRRALLMFSGLGMAVSMFVAGLMKMKIDNGSMAPNIGPAVCVLLYTIFNRFGFLNIPLILPSELFPLEIRGLLDGCMYAFISLLMFVIIKLYPYLPELMGGLHAVLWLFAGISLAAVLFILLFLPETHCKTNDEIQEYFQHNNVYLCRKREH